MKKAILALFLAFAFVSALDLPGDHLLEFADTSCLNAVAGFNRGVQQLVHNIQAQSNEWLVYADLDALDEVSYYLQSTCDAGDFRLTTQLGSGQTPEQQQACSNLLAMVGSLLEQSQAMTFRGGYEQGIALSRQALALGPNIVNGCSIQVEVKVEAQAEEYAAEEEWGLGEENNEAGEYNNSSDDDDSDSDGVLGWNLDLHTQKESHEECDSDDAQNASNNENSEDDSDDQDDDEDSDDDWEDNSDDDNDDQDNDDDSEDDSDDDNSDDDEDSDEDSDDSDDGVQGVKIGVVTERNGEKEKYTINYKPNGSGKPQVSVTHTVAGEEEWASEEWNNEEWNTEAWDSEEWAAEAEEWTTSAWDSGDWSDWSNHDSHYDSGDHWDSNHDSGDHWHSFFYTVNKNGNTDSGSSWVNGGYERYIPGGKGGAKTTVLASTTGRSTGRSWMNGGYKKYLGGDGGAKPTFLATKQENDDSGSSWMNGGYKRYYGGNDGNGGNDGAQANFLDMYWAI